jgi:hypothetical protein
MQRIDLAPSATTREVRRRSWRPSPANLAARAGKNGRVRIEFPHPLSWWRVRPAHAFKDIDVVIARHFLRKSAIIGEPYWFLGAAGDAAVALGVALRIQRQERQNLVSLDLAMTAVLCVALEGHTPAALLLSSSLQRRAGIEPLCEALSDTWLNVKAASP